MNFNELEDNYHSALEKTVIHRERKSSLFTFGATRLPYIFLAESAINKGDTILRKGEINTDKPAIITASDLPSFTGFGDDYEGKEKDMSVILGRSFRFSGLNYKNEGNDLEVIEKELQCVVDHYQKDFDNESNMRTAIISGPENCWALSILIYAASMTKKSAASNFNDMAERGKFSRGDDNWLGF